MKAETVKRTIAIPTADGSWTTSAEHLELRDVNGLVPDLWNARARSDQQLVYIASRIEFGNANPTRVDCHGMIMARHAPLLGVRSLPVIFAKRSSKS